MVLNRGGMGTQKSFRCYKKGVLHIPGRMVLGQIQRLKIIIVHLNLGALGYGKTQTQEYILYLTGHRRKRVQPARAKYRSRQGYIQCFGFQLALPYQFF